MTLPPMIGDLTPLLPAGTLLLFAVVTLLLGVFSRDRASLGVLALLGVVAALTLAVLQLLEAGSLGMGTSTLSGAFLGDAISLPLSVVILVGAGLAIVLADAHQKRLHLDHVEFHPLLLLATVGALVLVAAGDLITLLIGLEIMSLAVYVLAGWRERARASEEAGMKYFLLGAFASAVLVYGIALVFGATGRFDFAGIAAQVASSSFDVPWLLLLGASLVLVGLGFKVAFPPFHQWLPDVYTGAPTPVTAFMSVVVKAAAFGALARAAYTLVPAAAAANVGVLLPAALTISIALAMVFGNFAALLQSGVKRMLAYSAIAHAGYLGLAVLAGGDLGVRALGYYLFTYTLGGLGAFAALLAIMGNDEQGDRIERLHGLLKRQPLVAIALSVGLLSLAGFPPFSGFVGKALVFQAAMAEGHIALAVLGIATAVVAVLFYARVVLAMLFGEPSSALVVAPLGRRTAWVLLIGLVGTLIFGMFPGLWLDSFAVLPWLG